MLSTFNLRGYSVNTVDIYFLPLACRHSAAAAAWSSISFIVTNILLSSLHFSPVVKTFCFLWSPYGTGQTIIFSSCFFLLSFFLLLRLFLFPRLSQQSEVGCLPYFHTWCGLSANLECRSEMCCTRRAENTGRKKVAKNRHLGTIAQLCRAISS